jgi:hypothetical protein
VSRALSARPGSTAAAGNQPVTAPARMRTQSPRRSLIATSTPAGSGVARAAGAPA